MNNLLQFIWWVIFLGPIFKVFNMLRFIFSINSEKKIELSENMRNWIFGILTIISLFFTVEFAVHGFTLLAYTFIIIATFFILFLMSAFFQKKLLFFGIFLPVITLLGFWTGILAREATSPYYLELIIITIPFILPYVQYKIIFRTEKLEEYIEDYLQYIKNQIYQTKEIIKFTEFLSQIIHFYKEYSISKENLKKFEKKLSLKAEIEPKRTNLFQNKNYFVIKNEIFRKRKIVLFFREFFSVLEGGASMAGSDEELIIKSIGHFNFYLREKNKKQILKKAFIEINKGKFNLLNKIYQNNYLIFCLKYLSNEKDYKRYYNILKKQGLKLETIWNEIDSMDKFSNLQKNLFKKQIMSIKEMEKIIKKENKK